MGLSVFGKKPQQIKVAFMKKLRTYWTWGMLTVTRCWIFCLPICYTKI